MTQLKKRVVVVFNLSKVRRLGDFRYKVGGISNAIGGNTTVFATPLPTVLIVNGHITAMDAAQADVELRLQGSVAIRNAAFNVVVSDIRAWVRYVQALIDAEPDYEQQLIIAGSSAFDTRVNGVYIKPPLKAIALPTPGSVKLTAVSAGKNAAYNWQQSINNGSTWVELPPTNVANTAVSGLNAKASYLFRFRSVVKNVVSAWSGTVGLVIQ